MVMSIGMGWRRRFAQPPIQGPPPCRFHIYLVGLDWLRTTQLDWHVQDPQMTLAAVALDKWMTFSDLILGSLGQFR